jgi:hypothetical protein
VASSYNVILKIATHTGKMLHQIDSNSSQIVGVTYAGLQKHLRRVDRAERQHDLASRGNTAQLTVPKEFNPDGSLAVKQYAGHERARRYR